MTTIIAEAGINHNGNIQTAFKLIDVAVKAKADIIKFQTFKSIDLATPNAEKVKYQKKNGDPSESQQKMLRNLELTYEEHIKLMLYCQKKNIEFLSTPFDMESVNFLNTLNMKRWKIPSGEITNIPFIRLISSLGKPIILSTGMSKLSEIAKALEILQSQGISKDNITVLQCTTSYPTPMNQVNLRAMNTIANTFGVKVGFSDHTSEVFTPIAAVALGASVIEKHFTLNKNMEGPDHKASLEPEELELMIKGIRDIEKSLGDGIKRPLECELENIKTARKSIVASRSIKKGEIFSANNLTAKRPGYGISPLHWDDLLDRKSSRDYDQDELIEWS